MEEDEEGLSLMKNLEVEERILDSERVSWELAGGVKLIWSLPQMLLQVLIHIYLLLGPTQLMFFSHLSEEKLREQEQGVALDRPCFLSALSFHQRLSGSFLD